MVRVWGDMVRVRGCGKGEGGCGKGVLKSIVASLSPALATKLTTPEVASRDQLCFFH